MGTVLVTGGTGYIGGILVQELMKKNYDVIITTSKKQARDSTDDQRRYLRLEDPESVHGVCKDIQTVIHAATYPERQIRSHPDQAILANSLGTKLLLEDAREHKVEQFIYLSTFHVYGKNAGSIDEGTPPLPQADYGMTHLFAELYCRQMASDEMKTAVLRCTNGIGLPNPPELDRWYLVLNDMCRSAVKTGRVVLNSSGIQCRDFLNIRDIAGAVECVMNSRQSFRSFEVFNVSSQQAISIRDLAWKVAEVYSRRYSRPLQVDIPDENNAAECGESLDLFVCSKKLREYGWDTKYGLEDSICELFDYLVKE